MAERRRARRARPAITVVALLAAALTTSGGPASATPATDGTHTVVVFDEPVGLGDLVRDLADGSARPVGYEHVTALTRGGFSAGLLSLHDGAAAYRAAYARWHTGDPRVIAVRLAGPVDGHALDELGERVDGHAVVASDSTVAVVSSDEGWTVATDPAVAPASIPGVKPWSPEQGRNVLYNDTGVCFPGIISCAEARGADLYLTFTRSTPGDEFRDDWAYEHDFKLYNENNWDTDGICPANQRNDFWAYSGDGIAWDTTMPSPYLDTGASDNCRYHDLTVGTYHPRQFRTGTYWIGMVIAPGDHSRSPYQLRAEALDKDCDVSPWCVGIGGSGEGQLLVGTSRGVAPGCRLWAAGQDSSPC